MRKFFIFISTALTMLPFFIVPNSVRAQDYRADYLVEYEIEKGDLGLNTKATFSIKTTNLRSDVFVKKFSLSFPRTFAITDLTARDESGEIDPAISQDDTNYTISLEYKKPNIGKGSVNTFFLEFNQSNLFEVNGSIWEVILPTIQNRGEGNYEVQVTLPDKEKLISVSKPKPDKVEGNKITWINPKTKTIYAAFGKNTSYDLNLTYNLRNTKITPDAVDIALPPDTVRQKIYVDELVPRPAQVLVDDDGNYLARYKLAPKQDLTVSYKGRAELFTTSREDVKAYENQKLETQRKYLLSAGQYWNIKEPEKFSSLKSPQEIYTFIVSNFKYDFDKATQGKSIERLGAQKALESPQAAVCTEFSDTFVALAREKGILARELQGFAVSQDSRLRPLSQEQDVLHSWPEYYNEQSRSWTPIDPTWENTSGIDYFESLDLNHIVFAIHGKEADNPRPAGSYKITNSKDVTVSTSQKPHSERNELTIRSIKVQRQIADSSSHKGIVVVENTGNTTIYDAPVTITGSNLDILKTENAVDAIAPYQVKELPFEYRSQFRNRNGRGEVTAKVGNSKRVTVAVAVTPFSYTVTVGIALALLGVLLALFAVLKAKKRRKHV